MGRPTKFPEWADGGGAITEPTGAKKLLGWIIGEKPAAQFLNWLQNLSFLWLIYLDRQVALQFFGDGSDGSVTLDGAVTPSWASKVGSVYTLNRDIFMVNLIIAAAVTLAPNGFVIYGQGTLDVSAAGALITADGAPGVAQTAGAAAAAGTIAGRNAGGGGGVFGSSAGANGIAANRLGGAGGNGGSGGTSGSGGTGTALVNRQGKLNTLMRMPGWIFGTDGAASPVATWIAAQGGGGGGGGCTDNSGAALGGGGGAGGGVIAIWFVNIVHGAQPLSNVSAKGGNGANGAGGGGSAAGGGGGGGGWLDVLCVTKDVGGYVAANSCPGGTAGTSVGFGAAQAGVTGLVREYKLGA